MKFKPGQSGNPAGKPKGTRDKKTILRASVVMALQGVCPTEELISIAKSTVNEQTRIELWKYLQSFVEVPQRDPIPVNPETPEGSVANAEKVAAHLAELSKPLDPIPDPT